MGQYFGKEFTLRERWDDIGSVVLEAICEVGDLVLDLGCAEGWIAYECAKVGAKVIAVDNDKEKIENAKQHINITYRIVEVQYISGEFKPAITICNGVHNKLTIQNRIDLLRVIFDKTQRLVVIRTDIKYWEEVIEYAFIHGFNTCSFTKPAKDSINPALCFHKDPAQ